MHSVGLAQCQWLTHLSTDPDTMMGNSRNRFWGPGTATGENRGRSEPALFSPLVRLWRNLKTFSGLCAGSSQSPSSIPHVCHPGRSLTSFIWSSAHRPADGEAVVELGTVCSWAALTPCCTNKSRVWMGYGTSSDQG